MKALARPSKKSFGVTRMKRSFEPMNALATTHTARSITSLRRRTPSSPPHSRSARRAATMIAATKPAMSISP